jgi:hypothetical protein
VVRRRVGVILAPLVTGCALVIGLDAPTYAPAGVPTEAGDEEATGCPPDTADCNGDPSDGCETDISANVDNCGACKHSCDGATCTAGLCQPQMLTKGHGDVRYIAVDDDSVYFTSVSLWLLGRVSKQGGDATFLIPAGALQQPTAGLAVDDAFVYAPAFAGDAGSQRVPKDGGVAEVLDPCNTVFSIALDQATAFWVTAACGGAVRVRRRDKTGGTVTESGIDDGTYVIATYGYLGVDDASVFWENAFQIRTLDKSLAGPVRTVLDAGTDGSFRGIAIDDKIYATFRDRILAVDKTTGATTTLVTALNGTTSRVGLVVDDKYVYFAHAEGGVVARVPKSGGTVEPLAKNQGAPMGIALDANHVYWSNTVDGSIWRVAR